MCAYRSYIIEETRARAEGKRRPRITHEELARELDHSSPQEKLLAAVVIIDAVGLVFNIFSAVYRFRNGNTEAAEHAIFWSFLFLVFFIINAIDLLSSRNERKFFKEIANFGNELEKWARKTVREEVRKKREADPEFDAMVAEKEVEAEIERQLREIIEKDSDAVLAAKKNALDQRLGFAYRPAAAE